MKGFITRMLLIHMNKEAIESQLNDGHSIPQIAKIQGKSETHIVCVVCGTTLSGRQRMYCSIKCHNNRSNHTQQCYELQKARGLERKKKLVEMFGGKCKYCGYDENLAALEFHHRNPSEKVDNIDLRKMSNRSWEWCLSEAKKCDLVCANCHRNIHYPSLMNWQESITERSKSCRTLPTWSE